MIIVFLIVVIVALVIANVALAIIKPKKVSQRGHINIGSDAIEPEIVPVLNEISEQHALVSGSVEASNKKIELINKRLNTLESVVTTMVEKKLDSPKTNSKTNDESEIKIKLLNEFRDDAKIRIEVLESLVEKLNGKPLVKKKKLETFDKKTEDRIHSLVYNTRKN